MSKKLATTLIIVLGFFGAIVTFYGVNLLMSDVSNMFYEVNDIYFISSFPMFFLALDFTLIEIYLYRYIQRPQYKINMSKLYLIILGVFSLLGVVSSILTGTIVYHSFVTPYPFGGYTIIMLAAHILLLIFSVGASILLRKSSLKDDQTRKYSVQYIVYTVFLCFVVFFALNRLGALIFAPIYVELSTLYLTWPFYISLLVPTSILVHTFLHMYDCFLSKPKAGLIYAIINVALSVVMNLAVILVGYFNSAFVASVSPALPLERLATMPVDTIITVVITLATSIFALRHSIHRYKKFGRAAQ